MLSKSLYINIEIQFEKSSKRHFEFGGERANGRLIVSDRRYAYNISGAN